MVRLKSQLFRKFWNPCYSRYNLFCYYYIGSGCVVAVNAYYNVLVVKSNSDANYVHKEIVVRGFIKCEFSELKYLVFLYSENFILFLGL